MASALLHRASRMLLCGLRLRCPRCGDGLLFRGFFAMNDDCGVCGLHFEREPGYFVGAIYINYGVTTVLSLAGYFTLDAFADMTLTHEILVWAAFSNVFPLWFFRYSRSLWLALDHFFSPEPRALRMVRPGGSRAEP